MSDPKPGRAGSEGELVDWLKRVADPTLGDDCAILERTGDLAVTVDAQHEGVHLPSGLDPRLAAQRLLAVNLSDLAAEGATPFAAFLSLAAPPEYDRRRFLRGLVDGCTSHGITLRGGDLSALDCLSATLTLLGQRPPRGRWLTRSAARPGDTLWLGGTLGEAAAGLALLSGLDCPRRGLPQPPPRLRGGVRTAAGRALRRQLRPSPQLELGAELGRRRRVAAIDCSDGLGVDLGRLCSASGVGAEIEVERLPQPDARLCSLLGEDPLELALGGGEDYVLIFSLPPRARPPRQPGARRVGRFTEERSVIARRANGTTIEISTRGFDHLRRRG